MFERLILAAKTESVVESLLDEKAGGQASIVARLHAVDRFIVDASSKAAAKLLAAAGPVKVWRDQPMRDVPLLPPEVGASVHDFRAWESSWEKHARLLDHRAREVGVAVLGGGIEAHAVFGDRLRHVDVATGEISTSGHGELHTTQVAEVMAGNGAGGAIPGPASEATLYSFTFTTAAEMVRALDWIITNNHELTPKIRVIYTSREGIEATQREEAVDGAVQRAHEAGLVVCVAAGNDTFISSPGTAPHAITVGGCSPNGTARVDDDRMDQPSGVDRARCKPNMVCTWGPFAYSMGPSPLGGTSGSSALAAGHIARWFGAHPELTARVVRAVLAASGVRPADDPLKGCGAGWHGSIDFREGLRKVLELAGR